MKTLEVDIVKRKGLGGRAGGGENPTPDVFK